MEGLHAHLCHEHRVSAAIMKIEPNPRLASYLQQVWLDWAATKMDSGLLQQIRRKTLCCKGRLSLSTA